MELLVNQGVTTADIGKILVEDIDLRQGKIDIRGGRIGKDRTLELKSNQIMDIMEYVYKTRAELLKYHKQDTKQLFLSTPASGETQATGNGSLQIFKSLTNEIKEQNPRFINFLQVRSSVITFWLKQYNLRQVQYRAGHKHIISTEAYLINDIDDLQKEIDSFHPISIKNSVHYYLCFYYFVNNQIRKVFYKCFPIRFSFNLIMFGIFLHSLKIVI